MVANDLRHVRCNYCEREFHGGVTRLREHFAGDTSNHILDAIQAT